MQLGRVNEAPRCSGTVARRREGERNKGGKGGRQEGGRERGRGRGSKRARERER